MASVVEYKEMYLQHPQNVDRRSVANISTVTIRGNLWISHTPDFVIFQTEEEGIQGIPRPGSKCTYCKEAKAIKCHTKLKNEVTKECAGYRYCALCRDTFM
jgi:hypothetical protein